MIYYIASPTVRGNEPEENQGNVTRLPRTDIELYGTYPKMEPRVYVVCNCCSKVIRPCDAAAHLNQCFYSKDKAEETQPETPSSSNAVKKKSSQTKSKKKSILPKNVPPPPLFPVSLLLPFCPLFLLVLILYLWQGVSHARSNIDENGCFKINKTCL